MFIVLTNNFIIQGLVNVGTENKTLKSSADQGYVFSCVEMAGVHIPFS